NVVLVGGQVTHDLPPTGAADLGFHPLDPKRKPGSMAGGREVFPSARPKLIGRDVADRLEHGPTVRQLRMRDDERGASKVAEHWRDVVICIWQAAAHLGDRL